MPEVVRLEQLILQISGFFSSVLIRVTTVTAVTMDDFLLNSRFTTQRDIIVGGSDAVPDISHFVAEEIIISDVTSG